MLGMLLFLGPIGPMEIMIVLVIGLLLFGARLPEVGRSLGRSLLEFKKGLKGLQDEVGGIDREADHLVDAELERRRLEARPKHRPLDQPVAWDARPEEEAAHAPSEQPPEPGEEAPPSEPEAERPDAPGTGPAA
jgi:sec-independent protein translocase protein TatA